MYDRLEQISYSSSAGSGSEVENFELPFLEVSCNAVETFEIDTIVILNSKIK